MARRRRKKGDPIEALIVIMILASFFFTFQATKSITAAVAAVIIVFIICFIIAFFIKLQRVERLKRSGIADIDKMDGRQFEHYLGHLFKAHGYTVKVTQAAGDFGADLVIAKEDKKIVVQAKRYSKNVGIEAVQQVVGSIKQYGASEGWVISNRDYTDAAYTLAKSNSVRLINREELIDMILRLNPSTALTTNQIKTQMPKGEPTCEKCGNKMVRRKSTKGEVLACSTFPKCKNVKAI